MEQALFVCAYVCIHGCVFCVCVYCVCVYCVRVCECVCVRACKIGDVLKVTRTDKSHLPFDPQDYSFLHSKRHTQD